MSTPKTAVLQGTLDLMILRTLQQLGALHGYGIARRIEQMSGNAIELNHGTVYPALVRLERNGWIASEWGASANKRRARYYSLTKSGRKQLAVEQKEWLRVTDIMARFVAGEGGA
ncbi:MAG: PadR family transcriptional regulator [Terriglobia bacterium]